MLHMATPCQSCVFKPRGPLSIFGVGSVHHYFQQYYEQVQLQSSKVCSTRKNAKLCTHKELKYSTTMLLHFHTIFIKVISHVVLCSDQCCQEVWGLVCSCGCANVTTQRKNAFHWGRSEVQQSWEEFLVETFSRPGHGGCSGYMIIKFCFPWIYWCSEIWRTLYISEIIHIKTLCLHVFLVVGFQEGFTRPMSFRNEAFSGMLIIYITLHDITFPISVLLG